jgi:hypothetical protein
LNFRNFFERSADQQKLARLIFLTGDDPILKDVIIEHLGGLTGLWGVRERFEVKDVRSIVALWEEGSLMGARFIDVKVKGKLKNNKLWKNFLAKISAGKNYMMVSFQEEEPSWEGVLARPIFQIVECRFPKRNKERAKLVDMRLKMKGCRLDPEMLKELSVRIKSSEEVESAVTTLGILSQSCKITEREITYVVGERDDLRNTIRAISYGNTVVLLEEVERLDPIPLLSNWHSIFKKMYCWMNQTGEDDNHKEEPSANGDNEEDDEDEVSESLFSTEIKLSRYQLEDYKIAKKRYSPILIRLIMEKINGVYQDIRRGKKEGWQERVRFILTMVNDRRI